MTDIPSSPSEAVKPKETNFSELWSAELIRLFRNKQFVASQSLHALKNPESSYGRAHVLMLRLYDVCLVAIQKELADE